jgi:putative phosphoribosyl transferase
MVRIYENKELRNVYHAFQDRFEAGRMLAQMLESEQRDAQDMIAFAIPAGGVPVGLEISRTLKIPFDLIIVRKIPIPDNPEAGFGAIALEGRVLLNQELLSQLRLNPAQIEGQIARVRKELEKRNILLREGRPFPDLSGKTLILVDDGLASGYTMMASVHTAKNKGARKIVVAIPTAPLQSVEEIAPIVEELYCPNIRETSYFAVADAYKNWYDLSLDDVLELMEGQINAKC